MQAIKSVTPFSAHFSGIARFLDSDTIMMFGGVIAVIIVLDIILTLGLAVAVGRRKRSVEESLWDRSLAWAADNSVTSYLSRYSETLTSSLLTHSACLW